jgi:hypothetical protein
VMSLFIYHIFDKFCPLLYAYFITVSHVPIMILENKLNLKYFSFIFEKHDIQEFVLHTISFFHSRQMTDKQVKCYRGIYSIVYRQNLQVLRSLRRSSLPVRPPIRSNAGCSVTYQLLNRHWHTEFDYRLFCLRKLEIGLTAGVTDDRDAYSS